MKVGITCAGIGPYANGDFLRRAAQSCERHGFAHIWLPDHVVLFADYPESDYPYGESTVGAKDDQDPDAALQLGSSNPIPDPRNPFVDTIVALTWMAAATSRIEVGSNILVLPQHNPVILAKMLATLDSFSHGRVILGVGSGWAKEEYAACGADFAKRGKVLDEAIAVLRTLWTDEASSFLGEFFSFKDAYSFPKPARKTGIPILMGGESKPALRRLARVGDGWLPYNMPVKDAPRMIRELKDMTRAEGRDPDRLRIIKIVYTSAELDELKRYVDAGVTEFNVATSGEIPLDDAGMEAKIAEFAERLVTPLERW
jgi:probable F420-dependent oxidoreductase